FKALGRERYIHCPRRGTNPRGVEFSSEAFRMNIEQARKEGLVIDIDWKIEGVDIPYNPYARWVELWERD
ncbi:MAG: ThaI family type II restriction endonuclease, partial [Bacteroidia bacterium]|nr:ThaI family type II restriction endonuclease [Bacteroidia bacterium]